MIETDDSGSADFELNILIFCGISGHAERTYFGNPVTLRLDSVGISWAFNFPEDNLHLIIFFFHRSEIIILWTYIIGCVTKSICGEMSYGRRLIKEMCGRIRQ